MEEEVEEEVEEEINEERGRSISSTLQSLARKVTRHWDQRSPDTGTNQGGDTSATEREPLVHYYATQMCFTRSVQMSDGYLLMGCK